MSGVPQWEPIYSASLFALKILGKVGPCLEVEDWTGSLQELANHSPSFKLGLLPQPGHPHTSKERQGGERQSGCRGDIKDIWSPSLAELPPALPPCKPPNCHPAWPFGGAHLRWSVRLCSGGGPVPWACGVHELGVRRSSQRGLFALEKGAAPAAALDLLLGGCLLLPRHRPLTPDVFTVPLRSQTPRNSEV